MWPLSTQGAACPRCLSPRPGNRRLLPCCPPVWQPGCSATAQRRLRPPSPVMSSLPRASSGPCRLLPRALGPPAPVAPTLPVGGLSVSVPGPGPAGPRFSGCPEPSPHRPLLRGREVTPGWWARTHLLREGLQRALTGAGPSETGSCDAACRSLLAEGRGEVGKVSPASPPPLPFIPIPRSWGLAQGRPLLVCAWEDTPGGRSSLHLGQGSGVRGQVSDTGTWPSSVAPCSPRWLVRLCVSRRPRGWPCPSWASLRSRGRRSLRLRHLWRPALCGGRPQR